MSRIKGLVNCSVNFEVNKTAPLDSRTVISTVAELTQTATWEVDGKVWLYDGLVVSVTENNSLYMLKGFANDPLAYTLAENWVRLDASSVEKLGVVAGLDSTDDTQALAASQGKVLDDKIEAVKNSISSVYNYKGSVNDFASLPTDAAVGDVYNVGTTDGPNYAWNGTSWDSLGGTVDLSGYYTKEETDSAIETAVSGAVETITETTDALTTQINDNTSALTIINGTGDGSIAKTLETATDYTDTQLTAYTKTEDLVELISTAKTEVIETITETTDALNTRLETVEAQLEVLKGDKDTNGSILNTVTNAINIALEWKEV